MTQTVKSETAGCERQMKVSEMDTAIDIKREALIQFCMIILIREIWLPAGSWNLKNDDLKAVCFNVPSTSGAILSEYSQVEFSLETKHWFTHYNPRNQKTKWKSGLAVVSFILKMVRPSLWNAKGILLVYYLPVSPCWRVLLQCHGPFMGCYHCKKVCCTNNASTLVNLLWSEFKVLSHQPWLLVITSSLQIYKNANATSGWMMSYTESQQSRCGYMNNLLVSVRTDFQHLSFLDKVHRAQWWVCGENSEGRWQIALAGFVMNGTHR